MSKSAGSAGGFAAQNNGEIKNCYSAVQLKTKKRTAGGFVGENTGEISDSFACCKPNGLTGGFSGDDAGNTGAGCYYFHNEDEGSKKLLRLQDRAKWRNAKELTKENADRLGFDFENIWEYGGEKTPLQFIPEAWNYDVKQSALYNTEARPVTISNKAELLELAKKINGGDEELAAAHIQLTGDIDMGGARWTPIGCERGCAFRGLFDGRGHTVKNFTIKDKKPESIGFFGFLKGEVYNLSVDCRINGRGGAGGIAAHNEGGTVGCCGAVVEISGKGQLTGGLVGRNLGLIFESYTAGKISDPVAKGSFLLLLIPLLLLLAVLRFQLTMPTFAPVPYDDDAIPLSDGLTPNTAGNFVSFQFEHEVDVDLATGLCRFNFQNPGNSNHDIVVQLQFTDAQAVRIMGSTGRTEDEQQKLADTPGYDPENHRTVIAESDAIRSGYKLENLRLVEQPNGAAIPPGTYNAVIYLIFYDINSHNRAMLESQLPVSISVHN